ncbi:MAG: hypothetical protein KAG43_09780, partial [Candidatus Marithrix sp.]|nr:hypothetical protein [Candidatus Marithrix sp.]
MEYIISSFILLVLAGVWFYYRKKQFQRKQLQKKLEEKLAKEEIREKTRQKLFDFFKSKIDYINNAEKQFSKHFKVEAGYFSNYQLKVWQTDFASLFA